MFGATAVVRLVRKDPTRHPWPAGLLERKTVRVATVGLANKTARIAWAVMTRKKSLRGLTHHSISLPRRNEFVEEG